MNTVLVLIIFAILIFHDLSRFIKQKDPIKVIAIYTFIMSASLVVSLLLAAGRRPPGPAEWIEWMLKMIGVVR
ncbi:MAG: hypothetical protein PWQ82_1418 [Thermosediminibacterales bacterium]|nr:hypothetical protein [Thermosediminibacterales bacterium]MDK2835995.1 hypothetical protein [Thermosediminibacterales bacterium]